jgi:fermentation-respiration switch protein FrsA (DUF1100 family)
MTNAETAPDDAKPRAPLARRAMTIALAIAGLVALLYAGAVALLAFQQRDFIYQPSGPALTPAEAGLSGAERIRIRTRDGETLVAWFRPPAEGRALMLYFHGNAGSLAARAQRFAQMTQRGDGLLAIEYRGYPGSTGAPSEEGLLRDADAALSEAISRGHEPGRIVLVGESLGAAVALELATRRPVAGVVLESAFLSMRDMAARLFPWAPVGLLLRDAWRSDQRIARLRAPLLQLHGLNDEIVPRQAGEALFALAREPKTWRLAALSGHQPLEEALAQVLDFVEARAAAR